MAETRLTHGFVGLVPCKRFKIWAFASDLHMLKYVSFVDIFF
ncbi:unnamed protein product [Schistosoma mattheei]|uniref:Uncharacterized protein n=1 Tax=Schistosoma mattheei TaxID=31246 RepID=A0A3P7YW86_9TREM|nr:unnamed protein product [Schistosoma mattheei]